MPGSGQALCYQQYCTVRFFSSRTLARTEFQNAQYDINKNKFRYCSYFQLSLSRSRASRLDLEIDLGRGKTLLKPEDQLQLTEAVSISATLKIFHSLLQRFVLTYEYYVYELYFYIFLIVQSDRIHFLIFNIQHYNERYNHCLNYYKKYLFTYVLRQRPHPITYTRRVSHHWFKDSDATLRIVFWCRIVNQTVRSVFQWTFFIKI